MEIPPIEHCSEIARLNWYHGAQWVKKRAGKIIIGLVRTSCQLNGIQTIYRESVLVTKRLDNSISYHSAILRVADQPHTIYRAISSQKALS